MVDLTIFAMEVILTKSGTGGGLSRFLQWKQLCRNLALVVARAVNLAILAMEAILPKLDTGGRLGKFW